MIPVSETIELITFALFITFPFFLLLLFSSPSFSLSYMHFLSLHSHSLSLTYNFYHSHPISFLARFSVSHCRSLPSFSLHSHLLSLFLSILLSVFFFNFGNDTDTLRYA